MKDLVLRVISEPDSSESLVPVDSIWDAAVFVRDYTDGACSADLVDAAFREGLPYQSWEGDVFTLEPPRRPEQVIRNMVAARAYTLQHLAAEAARSIGCTLAESVSMIDTLVYARQISRDASGLYQLGDYRMTSGGELVLTSTDPAYSQGAMAL